MLCRRAALLWRARGLAMIFVWGSRFFGKVDSVKGLFHVATRFGHLWFIPLIPMGSMVVLDRRGGTLRGVPIPLSLRSILVAWLRAALIAAAVIALCGAFATLSDPRAHQSSMPGYGLLAGGVLAVGTFIASYFMPGVGKAGYARARALAEKIGLKEEGLVIIEHRFGRISEAEAAETLKTLAETQAQIDQERARLVR
jgi:hypothetical protein